MARRGGVLGVLVAWTLWCAASPAVATDPPERCRQYLDWVGEDVRARLAGSADVAGAEHALCRRAGLLEGGTPERAAETRRSPSPVRAERAAPGHSIRAPWAGVPLVAAADEDYGPILGQLARDWRVDTALGGQLIVDTGANRTIAAAVTAPRIVDYRFTDVVGTFSVAGIEGTEALAAGAGRLTGVVRTPDVDRGLLGRDVLLSRGRFCLDVERALLRIDCSGRGPPDATAPVYTTPSGHLLLEVAIEAVTNRQLALLDTGTLITTVAWEQCPADGIPTRISDPLGVRHGNGPTLTSTLLEQELHLTGAAVATRGMDPVLCHRTSRSRPLLILGMTFVNRFAAIEVDAVEAQIHFYR